MAFEANTAVGPAPASAPSRADAPLPPLPTVIRRFEAEIDRLAMSDSFLLLRGESGTGKSLIAEAIHQRSRRRDRPLIRVDCALDPARLDRELFGDPDRAWRNAFNQALGGTLYLTHLQRMPAGMQARLVDRVRKAVQSREQRQGGSDVRMIASITDQVQEARTDQLVREDLRILLDEAGLTIPPLRKRLKELPGIAESILEALAREGEPRVKSPSPFVNYVLLRHSWPGNLRELQQVLHRAHALAGTDMVQLGDLPADFLNAVDPCLLERSRPRMRALERGGAETKDVDDAAETLFLWARQDAERRVIPSMERQMILRALAETGGNQVQASKLLGITRATLRNRLRRFKIRREVSIRWQPVASEPSANPPQSQE